MSHNERRAERCAARSATGTPVRMDADITVDSVAAVKTRGGNTRYVLRDTEGREYTTFRPQIGEEASRYEGRPARIEFHEEERNGFRNVYLDAIRPAPQSQEGGRDDSDAEEAAWSAAVDAAPWLLGTKEPEREVPPEELYERLEPFKSLVSRDIREHDDGSDEDAAEPRADDR
jgi:hypothetical protein